MSAFFVGFVWICHAWSSIQNWLCWKSNNRNNGFIWRTATQTARGAGPAGCAPGRHEVIGEAWLEVDIPLPPPHTHPPPRRRHNYISVLILSYVSCNLHSFWHVLCVFVSFLYSLYFAIRIFLLMRRGQGQAGNIGKR